MLTVFLQKQNLYKINYYFCIQCFTCTGIICDGAVDNQLCSTSIDDVNCQPHAGGSRSAKRCLVANCNARVIHLPRHLREKHDWAAEDARCAVQKYRQHNLKQSKCKDYDRPRRCPVENCSAVVKRLDTHLVHSHAMTRQSSTYKQMLVTAKYCKTAMITAYDDHIDSLSDEQDRCMEDNVDMQLPVTVDDAVQLTNGDVQSMTAEDREMPVSASTTEHQLSAMRSIFENTIKNSSVNLEDVREQVRSSEALKDIEPRKLCDRVRAEARQQAFACLPAQQPTCALNVESDCRVNDDSVSEELMSECVRPSVSSSRKDIFSPEECDVLARLCTAVIVRGPISYIRTRELLSGSAAGLKLLQKYSLFQLINRLKYERRKSQRKHLNYFVK